MNHTATCVNPKTYALLTAKVEQTFPNSRFVTMPSNFGSGTTTLPAPNSIRTSSGRATPRTATNDPKLMSEAQSKFIRKLIADRENVEGVQAVRDKLNAHRAAGTLTTKVASDAITTLKLLPIATPANTATAESNPQGVVSAGDPTREGSCKCSGIRAYPSIDCPVHTPVKTETPREKPKSKPNQYAGKCGNCGKRVGELEGVREFIETDKVNPRTGKTGKWVVWHREGECPSSNTFPFPDGRYAVDNAEGLLRFYHCYDGKVFVMASSTEHRVPDASAKSIIEKIAIDPAEASKVYGKNQKHCGVCGRSLTDTRPGGSQELGIGPVCASKMGW